MSDSGISAVQTAAVVRLPKGWRPTQLAEVAEINPGRVRPKFEDSDVTFLAMGDVSENGKILKRQTRAYRAVAKGFTSFAENDVLVAKITPCFENGKGAIATQLQGGVGFGSTEFHVVRAKSSMACPEFLHLHTCSDLFRKQGEKNMVGSVGQKRVPTEFLRRYLIALPPVREQKAIVSILSSLDEKLRVCALQISATITLQKGLSQTLFSRGIGAATNGRGMTNSTLGPSSKSTLPTNWQERLLGDIAPLVRRAVDVQPETSYPELGIRSFGKGTFHKPALRGTEVGGKRLFQIRAGDLLLSNVFAWEGAVAIAKLEDDGRFGSHRYITCEVDRTQADTTFLLRYLTTPAGIAQLTLASPGGAGRNRTLGLSALANIAIRLPPLHEQRKIGQILESVAAKLRLLESKQLLYQTLKRGLLQKLLTGEWQVNVDIEAGMD